MTDKKEHILKIAEDLFAQNGFEGTSVRQLATKAKVNIAMISYYFGSKEKLLEELIKSRSGEFRKKLKLLIEEVKDPWERVEIMIDYYVDRRLSNLKLQRILHREISLEQRSWLKDIISETLLKNSYEIQKVIEKGIEKKVFKKVDTSLTVLTIIGTISQITISSAFFGKLAGLPADPGKINEKQKERIKKHLKELLKSYLLRS